MCCVICLAGDSRHLNGRSRGLHKISKGHDSPRDRIIEREVIGKSNAVPGVDPS